jgi:transketolase C-terminal domain/subunit
VNVGIAEQSMVGTAAGLALGGKVAVTCNAAPFLISRANEQIKVDVCYNNTNVKLFGLNAGASYGPLASTHHAIDDLAVMRGFGNIQIFARLRRANVGRLSITPSAIRGRSIFASTARRCRSCTMKAIALCRRR